MLVTIVRDSGPSAVEDDFAGGTLRFSDFPLADSVSNSMFSIIDGRFTFSSKPTSGR